MSENKKKRANTPPRTEAEVLERSRRRCCLCAYIDGDWRQKKGQIAHLDHDPSNWKFENLVFLCLDHHSEYDSTTSQHKNYRLEEVRTYRNRLYEEVQERIARGIQYADEAAVAPYVLVVGVPRADQQGATVTLQNFARSPGLITQVHLYASRRSYSWKGKCVVAAESQQERFNLDSSAYWNAPPVTGDEAWFEVEVCDLAEVVTRWRKGLVLSGGRFG